MWYPRPEDERERPHVVVAQSRADEQRDAEADQGRAQLRRQSRRAEKKSWDRGHSIAARSSGGLRASERPAS